MTRTEDKLRYKIAQAYQIIGQLTDRCGIFDEPEVQSMLSHFSDPDGHLDDDLLPWPPSRLSALLAGPK